MQADLDATNDWVLDWSMQLNESKCVVVHMGGKLNSNKAYTIRKRDGTRVELQSSEGEKDLGVKVDHGLEFRQQIRSATAKAYSMIGMLKNAFVSRDVEIWKNLYVSMVRPHLEYAVSVWSPHLRKDIDALEKVQERVLRIPHELHKLSGYKERLNAVGLTTVEERRIEVILYKRTS